MCGINAERFYDLMHYLVNGQPTRQQHIKDFNKIRFNDLATNQPVLASCEATAAVLRQVLHNVSQTVAVMFTESCGSFA